MNTLNALQQRVSMTKLQAPAPDIAALIEVFKAAIRAADHGKLQPWRFLVIENDGLEKLGDIFVAASLKNNPDTSPSVIDKSRNMPRRAPMIIVAIADCKEHPSIPKLEQILACGAATQNMLNAFFALGYGAVWRTGDMAYSPHVKQELGLGELEEIVGYIYVGTPAKEFHKPDDVDVNAFFKVWPAK